MKDTLPLIAPLQAEKQIQFVKDKFLSLLKTELKLHQVFAPLYVSKRSGLNDDLNGTERPVSFSLKASAEEYSVVHSLAKWKRKRIKELSIPLHEGLVTNMVAIRADEDLSPIHSALVDQWDWEMHISKEDRTLEFLKTTVSQIYQQVRLTAAFVSKEFALETPHLPEALHFVHSEDLLTLYPDKTPKEREDAIVKEFGAVFLMGIGAALADGKPHDGRAPDYDDWTTPTSATHKGLNGDILVWNPALEKAFELSSMGIRVSEEALASQLKLAGAEERRSLPFHTALLKGELPYSIGGGIGQSRLAMFLLGKKAISEVQYSEN